MAESLDRRSYDLLRLIDEYEPIGSIRLVDCMQRRGYSIKGRTVRLALSELDDRGLTEKVPGKGRRLTDAGRAELDRGDIHGRRERVRARIATLTSQVTYDPFEDIGEVIASAVTVSEADADAGLEALSALADTPIGPVPVATERAGDDWRLLVPSSLTLDGVLLSRGIRADLETAALAEYRLDPDSDAVSTDPADDEGAIVRYTDAISGERSTMDIVTLLLEARRTSATRLIEGTDPALLVVDNREVPLVRYEETRDLSETMRDRLGGILDLRRPRESGPFPLEKPTWDFASLTYGAGEIALSLLVEEGIAASFETLSGLVPRSEFESAAIAVVEE
ncbi:NrpR regulatory domain-containing protein [Halosolutus gelatinilyticus]|uniref:NrpR regulatory domain-containing protein n=1 Tax=Halosolutus gelatinilyticus TaxID=2931975 RepID=UPI001FF348E7|nr:NrpR regulatory domain-containing protein [Halosolutus gelatinilyticus]